MRVDYVVRAIAELLNDGELVYVGLNSGPAILGAFMARDLMKKDIDIVGVAEAFNPKSITLSPSTGDPFFLEGSPVMITVDSFDLAQKGELDVMFLGPAQIDEETNVNLTAIGDYERPKVKLPGGAATAYLMPLVKKMILWNLKHSKRSFVKRVDFVTGSARLSRNSVYVVSDMAVMRYDRSERRWKVIGLYPWSTLDEVKERTEFGVEEENPRVISITEEEKRFIEKLDPYELRSALEFP